MKLQSKYVPLAATVALFIAMSIFGSVSYTGFFSVQALVRSRKGKCWVPRTRFPFLSIKLVL